MQQPPNYLRPPKASKSEPTETAEPSNALLSRQQPPEHSAAPEHYDAIVVGARCAGAAFAAFYAQGGARVLLVDQAELPSDVVLSTHALHPSGMAVIRALGLFESVAALTPEMSCLRIDWHGAKLDLQFPAGHGEYCPRRKRFDHLLQQAAVAAGAELRDRTQVIGLLQEGKRVIGARLRNNTLGEYTVRAPLVVGADGRDSRVAHWVNSPMYYDYEPPRGIYWSYWPAPKNWGKSTDFPAGMYTYRSGTRIHIAFHTDHDQLLLGALPLTHELEAFRSAPLANLRESLSHNPMLACLVQADPLEAPRGYLGKRYFFRQGCGPGWLLLGDAGIHKDFLSGDGMSEALIQAQSAATGLLTSEDETQASRALHAWWIARDLSALPLYFNTQDLARPEAGEALNRLILPRINQDPALRARFASTFARSCSPYDVLPAPRVFGWLLLALLKGNTGTLPEFIAQGKRVTQLKRELRKIHSRRPMAEDVAPPESTTRTSRWCP